MIARAELSKERLDRLEAELTIRRAAVAMRGGIRPESARLFKRKSGIPRRLRVFWLVEPD